MSNGNASRFPERLASGKSGNRSHCSWVTVVPSGSTASTSTEALSSIFARSCKSSRNRRKVTAPNLVIVLLTENFPKRITTHESRNGTIKFRALVRTCNLKNENSCFRNAVTLPSESVLELKHCDFTSERWQTCTQIASIVKMPHSNLFKKT
jgi:hypothetical protein